MILLFHFRINLLTCVNPIIRIKIDYFKSTLFLIFLCMNYLSESKARELQAVITLQNAINLIYTQF